MEQVKAQSSLFPELVEMKKNFQGLSVWRLKNGLSQLVDRLIDNLNNSDDNDEEKKQSISLNSNEKVESLSFNRSNSKMQVKTNKSEHEFDLVVSALSAKQLANVLNDSEFDELRSKLNKIEFVNMVVINLYFKKRVLNHQGFGYLVPSSEKSSILGCIFDSVFNEPNDDYTNLTVMMGGAWYDKVIGNRSSEQVFDLAYKELSTHLNLGDIRPDHYEVSFLKVILKFKIFFYQI